MKWMMATYLRLLLLSVLLASCGRTPSADLTLFDAAAEGVSIAGVEMKLDSVSVPMGPYAIVGDRLIMTLSMKARNVYAVCKIKGDSLIYENAFLQRGNGAYEMNVPILTYRAKENDFLIYSRTGTTYYKIDLGSFENAYNKKAWQVNKLPFLSRGEIAFVSDSVYMVGYYGNPDTLLALAYKDRNNYYKSLNFPFPSIPDKSNMHLKYSLFMGNLIKHPSKQAFLFNYKYFKNLSLFKLGDQQIKELQYLSDVVPTYFYKDDPNMPFALPKELETGFKRVRVTEKYIYIGYNNQTYEQANANVFFKGYGGDYFDRIIVFDWEGKFITRLVLDTPVSNFVVSEADEQVYASTVDLTKEEQPRKIIRFPVPASF